MNSLLAAEGRKLNSGAGGLGGGISRRAFSSCFRKASLAAACRLAGESFTPATVKLPEAEPFKVDAEAFRAGRSKTEMKERDCCRSRCFVFILNEYIGFRWWVGTLIHLLEVIQNQNQVCCQHLQGIGFSVVVACKTKAQRRPTSCTKHIWVTHTHKYKGGKAISNSVQSANLLN